MSPTVLNAADATLHGDPFSPGDLFAAHCRLLDTVTNAGVTPPDAWTQLRQRFTDFINLSAAGPLLERLVTAVLDEPDADLPTLRAAALAEQLDQVKIVAAVRGSALARLRAIYAESAIPNYAAMVALFDAQAGRFVATTRQVDVETPAAGMVDETDKARRAWLDAERDSGRLTALIGPLHAAARLTGRVPAEMPRDSGGRDACLIPLCCNTTDLHRRRVWEAWNAEGRCGRWSALVTLGAEIRALPANQLEGFEAYALPKPMEKRYKPSPWPYSPKPFDVDPEDAGYKPQFPEPVKKKPRRQLAP
jgi:hypothetical protein